MFDHLFSLKRYFRKCVIIWEKTMRIYRVINRKLTSLVLTFYLLICHWLVKVLDPKKSDEGKKADTETKSGSFASDQNLILEWSKPFRFFDSIFVLLWNFCRNGIFQCESFSRFSPIYGPRENFCCSSFSSGFLLPEKLPQWLFHNFSAFSQFGFITRGSRFVGKIRPWELS